MKSHLAESKFGASIVVSIFTNALCIYFFLETEKICMSAALGLAWRRKSRKQAHHFFFLGQMDVW